METQIAALEDDPMEGDPMEGDPTPGAGPVVSLAELANRALADPRFDELTDFDNTFGARSVEELLSRTSRTRRGFTDFFSQRLSCPFPGSSSSRQGDQIDALRASVASDLGVQIDDFLCAN